MPIVDQIFGADGLLSRSLDQYEKRDGQIELTKHCLSTLRQRGALIAEAPTGSGKSYAAIVALSRAVIEDKKVQESTKPGAILTGTIALQEQLTKKDLPTLQAILPWKFTFGILKGRSNYLCRTKMYDAINARHPLAGTIASWEKRTESGDRTEIEIDDKGWVDFSSNHRSCLGKGCPFEQECYPTLARRRALSRDVVVASYHSAFAHGLNNASALASFGHIICDEAHELPRLTRKLLGWSLSIYDILWFTGVMVDVMGPLGDGAGKPTQINELAEQVFSGLVGIVERAGQKVVRVRKERSLSVDRLVDLLLLVAQRAEQAAQADTLTPEVKSKLGRLEVYGQHFASCLTNVDVLEYPDSWVYWLEQHLTQRKRKVFVSIEGHPFVVARSLRQKIFGLEPATEITTGPEVTVREGGVILMSATLRNTSGFTFIRGEVGAPQTAQDLAVRSPFVLAKQAALVVPTYVPVPPKYGCGSDVEDAYLDRVTAAAAELVLAMGGRTLCLFTSWRALDHAHDLMTRAPKLDAYEILKQGDLPTQRLVAKFAENETSVLLGVASLWQGVDVPGDALKGLFIHKIPFPTPKDPINEAMSESLDRRYGKGASFGLWSIPLATVMLQQGMGRLIRTVQDRGVIVIPDRRLTEYGYGKQILKALPRFSRFPSTSRAQDVMPSLFTRSEGVSS